MKIELVEYDLSEKVLNSVSHGITAIAMIVGGVFLYLKSASTIIRRANLVYAICLFVMLFNSALYHGVPKSRFAYVMRAVDHSSIFLAIAGTYTPLLFFGKANGFSLFFLILIWTIALIGIGIKIWAFSTGHVKKVEKLSIVMYIIMGWISLFLIPHLIRQLTALTLFCIVLGGIFYTVGVFFYKKKTMRMNHFIWHLFIIGGVLSHYAAIYFMTAA